MNGFEPSLLDKLFDDDPGGALSPVVRRISLEDLKAAVARDLETLLNARMVTMEETLAMFPQCRRSTLTYGVNDFSGLSLASFYDRSFICRSIERAIERHEPRLRNVHVELGRDRHGSTNVLYFGITALLCLPDISEPVNFDALLQPSTLQYAVSHATGHTRAHHG